MNCSMMGSNPILLSESSALYSIILPCRTCCFCVSCAILQRLVLCFIIRREKCYPIPIRKKRVNQYKDDPKNPEMSIAAFAQLKSATHREHRQKSKSGGEGRFKLLSAIRHLVYVESTIISGTRIKQNHPSHPIPFLLHYTVRILLV